MRANRILGFTLIEMLIAIGILAMIAVLGWRGLDSMLRSRVALTDSMQQTRAMQRTFAQLQDDCAHLAVVEAIGEYARLRIEPNRFGLIRSVLAPDQATSLQAVVYQVDNGTLRRRESPPSRDLQSLERFLLQPIAGSAVRDTPLQDGILGMAVRTWTDKWTTLPDTTSRGLEMTLLLHSGDGQISRLFLLGPA
jgi:general secretion pathway protein J